MIELVREATRELHEAFRHLTPAFSISTTALRRGIEALVLSETVRLPVAREADPGARLKKIRPWRLKQV